MSIKQSVIKRYTRVEAELQAPKKLETQTIPINMNISVAENKSNGIEHYT
jgi:hypothetical protein